METMSRGWKVKVVDVRQRSERQKSGESKPFENLQEDDSDNDKHVIYILHILGHKERALSA